MRPLPITAKSRVEQGADQRSWRPARAIGADVSSAAAIPELWTLRERFNGARCKGGVRHAKLAGACGTSPNWGRVAVSAKNQSLSLRTSQTSTPKVIMTTMAYKTIRKMAAAPWVEGAADIGWTLAAVSR